MYPSITLELLERALIWAKTLVDISDLDMEIIKKAKKSFLFTGKTPWIKKGDINFDVGMGAFDGAECCDLIGLFLLHQLSAQIQGLAIGLYRDDEICISELTARLAKKVKFN